MGYSMTTVQHSLTPELDRQLDNATWHQPVIKGGKGWVPGADPLRIPRSGKAVGPVGRVGEIRRGDEQRATVLMKTWSA